MRPLVVAVCVFLMLHGLVHLLGAAAYLRLAEVPQLAYKTNFLGGRVDLGARGTTVFGVLWVVAAIGFLACGIGLLFGARWQQPLLVGVTLLSLVLTALDWEVAYAGAVIDAVILLVIGLGPRLGVLAR